MNTTVETPATDAAPKSRWKMWVVGFFLLSAGGYARLSLRHRRAGGKLAAAGTRRRPRRIRRRSRRRPGRWPRPNRARPRRAGRQAESRRLPACARHGHAGGHGDGAAASRACCTGALQGRPAGEQGPAAGDHRPAPVRDGADAGHRPAPSATKRNSKTRLTLQRYQTLLQQDSIARQEVDTQAALVRQLNGDHQSRRPKVASARLNLSYARIVAPIDGRVGLRQVDVGNLVRSGDENGIVVITQTPPISATSRCRTSRVPEALRAHRRLASMPVIAPTRSNWPPAVSRRSTTRSTVQTGTVRATASRTPTNRCSRTSSSTSGCACGRWRRHGHPVGGGAARGRRRVRLRGQAGGAGTRTPAHRVGQRSSAARPRREGRHHVRTAAGAG